MMRTRSNVIKCGSTKSHASDGRIQPCHGQQVGELRVIDRKAGDQRFGVNKKTIHFIMLSIILIAIE